MEKARRRRHVPAFGEWNYYYSSSTSSPDEPPQLPPSSVGAAVAAWYAPEPEACSDVWFRYSPPPRRPAPKKARRRPEAEPEKLYYGGGKGSIVVPVTRGRSSGSGVAGAVRTPGKAARRVVRPVDEDLYQVPPPDSVCGRSGRMKKSLWMGCLGLNCVA